MMQLDWETGDLGFIPAFAADFLTDPGPYASHTCFLHKGTDLPSPKGKTQWPHTSEEERNRVECFLFPSFSPFPPSIKYPQDHCAV